MGPAKQLRDLSRTLDSELIDGSHGVFASSWVDAKQEPKRTANYLVVVRNYEPIVALYIRGLGWQLRDTIHTGLESSVRMWMDLPKGQQ